MYFEEEPGRRSAAHLLTGDEAWRIAADIAKLPGAGGEARLDFSERSDATSEITTRQDSVLLSPATHGGWPLRQTHRTES